MLSLPVTLSSAATHILVRLPPSSSHSGTQSPLCQQSYPSLHICPEHGQWRIYNPNCVSQATTVCINQLLLKQECARRKNSWHSFNHTFFIKTLHTHLDLPGNEAFYTTELLKNPPTHYRFPMCGVGWTQVPCMLGKGSNYWTTHTTF